MSHARDSHHGNYFAIFLALCVLTGLSVVADVIDLDNKRIVLTIVFAIATAKALFVMLYFMHLKFEGNWKYVLLAPTIILAMGIPLALLPDIGVHYYVRDVPQQQDVRQLRAGQEAERQAEQNGQSQAPNDGHGH
ncbi:MAG: cytochrome C oxidase subunit IV family protein [Planctomycetaceae bacterium]